MADGMDGGTAAAQARIEDLLRGISDTAPFEAQVESLRARAWLEPEVRRYLFDVGVNEIFRARLARRRDTIAEEANAAPAPVNGSDAPKPRATFGVTALMAASAGHASSLMSFPLRGGLPLGDASAEQVRDSREHYDKQGRTMIQRGRFLAAVLERLPDGKRVREALTPDDLARCWQRSLQQVAA